MTAKRWTSEALKQLRLLAGIGRSSTEPIPMSVGQFTMLLDEIDACRADAKWLLSEFALDHWQSCDIPDEEDGGCYLCHGYREMRDRYEA